MAVELDEKIDADEFRTLNRCLDNGIADTVTKFSHQCKLISDDREEQALQYRLGTLVHELQVHIDAASHAIKVIKSGQVGFGGAPVQFWTEALSACEHSSVDRWPKRALRLGCLPITNSF